MSSAALYWTPVSVYSRYWQLDLLNVPKGKEKWDKSVAEASEEYKHRMVVSLSLFNPTQTHKLS